MSLSLPGAEVAGDINWEETNGRCDKFLEAGCALVWE